MRDSVQHVNTIEGIQRCKYNSLQRWSPPVNDGIGLSNHGIPTNEDAPYSKESVADTRTRKRQRATRMDRRAKDYLTPPSRAGNAKQWALDLHLVHKEHQCSTRKLQTYRHSIRQQINSTHQSMRFTQLHASTIRYSCRQAQQLGRMYFCQILKQAYI